MEGPPLRGRQRRFQARWWPSHPKNAGLQGALGPPVPGPRPAPTTPPACSTRPSRQEGRRRRAARPGADRRRQFRGPGRQTWPARRWKAIPSCSKPRNCWRASRSKTTTTPRPPKRPRRRWPSTPTRCRARPFSPPSTGWPTRRKRPGIRTTPAATRPPGTSSSLNRRYEEGIAVLPQGDRAGPAPGQRALPTGHQPDAPGPERRSLQAARNLLQQRLPATPPPTTP